VGEGFRVQGQFFEGKKTVQTLRGRKACISASRERGASRALGGGDKQMAEAIHRHRDINRTCVTGDTAGTTPLVRSPRSPLHTPYAWQNKNRRNIGDKKLPAREREENDVAAGARYPSTPHALSPARLTIVPVCWPLPPLDARSGRESPDRNPPPESALPPRAAINKIASLPETAPCLRSDHTAFPTTRDGYRANGLTCTPTHHVPRFD